VDSTTLASGLFVLAALFIRTAIAALAFTILTALLAALLIGLLTASRLVILLISARCLLAAALLTFFAALLSEILFIVCHIYSSPGFVSCNLWARLE
jgi:hypothetical protein